MKKTTNKTTTPTTFADLIKNYNADPRNADHLNDLATAVTYSVLRKVIDPTRHGQSDRPSNSGQNSVLVNLRKDLTRDREYLTRLEYATNNATRLTYDESGDLITETVDPDLAKAAVKLLSETIGDGLDLVNDTIVAILDETAKQLDRDPSMPTDLERPYTTRRLKRKIWIKTADSKGGFETIETTPIQEIFRATRRAIQNSRAIQTDPRNGYCYLADLAIDPETGDGSTIYRRLSKYADIGGDGTTRPAADYIPGQPAGLDGKPGLYSADRETVETTDRLIAAMKLSDREATVLKYRFSRYGKKAIATVMGIDERNVYTMTKRIQAKAEKIGLTADRMPPETTPKTTPKTTPETTPETVTYTFIDNIISDWKNKQKH